MTSDDSIQTDAPTVHRNSDVVDGQSGDQQNLTDGQAPAQMEPTPEAKTVIRGSSRVGRDMRSLGRSPASVAKILLGKHLDHFLLEEMIGGGGMGAVFRAHDEQLDRTVAIKVIPFVGDDQDLHRRFRNEAQSAAKLDHPRIARVFEVGHYDDWHYIVFEYIHGTNVRDLVNQAGVLHVDDAVFYTCELAEALQHAADRGIVHRDIKPSNVLIGEENKIKLVDMGLARSDNLELTGDETASGVTLGTFDYISPEQASDPRVADLRSDIYSLGCTLYFMLTGSPPFPGGTMLQKLLSHGSTPPPDVSRLRSEVSSDLSAVIRKMLAKKPENRYQTATELIADLREVALRDGLVRSKRPRAIVISRPLPAKLWLERHTPWLVAVSLLLISAVGVHLASAPARDQFSLTASSDAETLGPVSDESLDPGSADADSAAVDGVDSVNQRPASDATTATDTSTEMATDADSPRLELPIPPELKSEATPGAPPFGPVERAEGTPGNDDKSEEKAGPDDAGLDEASDNEASDNEAGDNEAGLDEASDNEAGPNEAGANEAGPNEASDETGFNAELDAPFSGDASWNGIAPNVIRVLGQREGMDLLADPHERFQDGVLLSASLAEALSFAKRFAARRVEIAAPLIYSEPVTIDTAGLLITSTVGGSVIVFESRDETPLQRAEMIDIGSNPIELDDIHLVWNVPPSLVDGGSMIAVNDNHQIRLTDCSITIDNLSSLDGVYAFHIATDPDSIDWSRRPDAVPDDGTLPLVAIELNNVIVRGQMTMIHLDYATELQLHWDNGLVAISQRMIDTAGARVRPPVTAPPMQLSLTRLTAHVPMGLLRMRVGANEYPMAVDREAQSSVFVVDAGVPHVDIVGVDSRDNKQSIVEFRGEANAYAVDREMFDPILSIADNDGQVDVTQATDLYMTALPWFTEKSPRWSVRWSSQRLATVAPNMVQPHHYLQHGTVVSGFDEKSLPRFPSYGSINVDTDTRVGDSKRGENGKNPREL